MTPNRRLRQARELRGWSQARMAEMIGTDATTVSRWERGLFLPTPYFREKLCECFGQNAEELGLLNLMTGSHLQGVVSPSREPGMDGGSSFAEQPGMLGRGEVVALKPRVAPEDVDTFTYILQRSSQEQQAYMLWEHAYVQALQDQPAEAQRLGQASVSVFEQVRHPNAAVVRAWLQQQGLLSAASSSSADAARSSKIQHKRASRPWLRVGGASVFVMLVLVAGLLLSGITSNRSNPPATGDIKYSPLAFGDNNHSTTPTSHTHTSTIVIAEHPNAIQTVNKGHAVQPLPSTPLPAATPIPTPIPTLQQTSTTVTGATNTTTTDPSITPMITPLHLSPQNCPVDGQGFRCTVTLTTFANTDETISWQASSKGIGTRFNSFSGMAKSGTPLQLIVYVYPACPQDGTLSFKLFTSSPLHADTVSTSWSC